MRSVRSARSHVASLARLGRVTATLACLLLVAGASAQTAPPEGMRESPQRAHAITNATVVVRPGETLEGATVVIRDGLIEAVGTDATVPADAKIWDGTGLRVYPGLIDAAVFVPNDGFQKGPGGHWNEGVHPELRVADLAGPDANLRKSLRENGFTTAACYPASGIVRGTGAVVSTAENDPHVVCYSPDAAMAVAFDRGGRGYPTSLMGTIALLRQVLHDANWHRDARAVWAAHPDHNEPPIRADALVALEPVVAGNRPVLFEVTDEHDFLRAAKLLDEFELQGAILGSGTEFRRIGDVLATGRPIVLPLDYPDRPDVTSVAEADNTSLRDLLTWEQAPTNPRRLIQGGATVALTTHALDNRRDFFERVRQAMTNGLTEDQALAAVTTVPATMLGIEHLAGTVEPGKIANLVVVEGSLFGEDATIRDTWVDGRRYEIKGKPRVEFKGPVDVTVELGGGAAAFNAKGAVDTTKPSVSVTPEGGKAVRSKKAEFVGDRLLFLIDASLFGSTGYAQGVATYSGGEFRGHVVMPDGTRVPLVMTPAPDQPEKPAADDAEQAADPNAADAQDDDAEKADAEDDAPEPENQDEPDEEAADDPAVPTAAGRWTASFSFESMPEPMTVVFNLTEDEAHHVTGTVESEFFTADVTNGTFDPDSGALVFDIQSEMGESRFDGTVDGDALSGTLSMQGMVSEVTGTRDGADETEPTKKKTELEPAPETLVFPLGAYGLAEPPTPQSVLVTNATVWTAGPEGIIEHGYLHVVNGKIEAVGSGDPPQVSDDTLVIDAQGKHVTPGLIDCHSHTGIDRGVNEVGQVVTAEVRVRDAIDPDDINWYRQLAGGLTAANQLHGSANPIGGQNSVVKLKWGHPAAAYPVQGAIEGIKFALGENVKRSQDRYPNTRMGVETVIRDAFTRAKEYRAAWDRYQALSPSEKARTVPPRRNLELDALVEILEGDRLVHCHSYRQDEILALIRTAEDFGFTIGTLQHILEGYKVAEAIADHGAGASSFSDWWAYKVEVMDAIPHNGALMHDVGVVVSFNSDSSELARRMNTEAAKAVRYGGVPREEAIKFVTLNPAKQLRIDDRVGSLEPGKDADFVVWSGDPLSTLSRCEQTWIEGARYFDLEEDLKMRERVKAERQRLIQKILAAAHGEAKGPDSGDAAGEGSGDRPGRGAWRGRGPRHAEADADHLTAGALDVRGELLQGLCLTEDAVPDPTFIPHPGSDVHAESCHDFRQLERTEENR